MTGKEKRIRIRVSACYQSFIKTGYTCGGCINYSHCPMSKRDTEEMLRLIRAMEQR